jgi:hypothetical protein
MHTKNGRQSGSTLIMVIGLAAALAILATSLVVLTGNVQSNTARDRTRAKAFNVAEAAVDSAIYAAAIRWPINSALTPVFNESGFRAGFGTDEFPNPATGAGDFSQVWYYDNTKVVGQSIDGMDTNHSYDTQPDGRLWVIAQAGVGARAARIQVEIEQTYFEPIIPKGNVLYAGGDLLSNGGGNNPKIHVDELPPGETTVAADVEGRVDNMAVFQPDVIDPNVGAESRTLEEIFPEEARQGIIDVAKTGGRYFGPNPYAGNPAYTTLNAAVTAVKNSPASQMSHYGELSGLTVVEATSGTLDLDRFNQLNTEEYPGVLMVIGGAGIDLTGNKEFWGMIYCEGTVSTSRGTPEIHGMLLTTGDIDIRGTADITFDYSALVGLGGRWSVTAKMVRNTWRELTPV